MSHTLRTLACGAVVMASACMTGHDVMAQTSRTTADKQSGITLASDNHLNNIFRNNNIFRHLDIGVSLGTVGLGLDVATEVTDYVRLRTGVSYTPHFNVPMHFSLQSYTDGGINSGNFESMQKWMKQMTGTDVDDRVDMDGTPMMTNYKLLVDVYPWRDKGWHVTAGFYLGKRRAAKAVNTRGEMPSLVAVNIYNHFYDYFMTTDFFEEPFLGHIYLDPFAVEDIRADLEENGQMGIHVGDFKDGTPYMMQPDSDGMVKADAFINAFKPYLGLGYTTPIGLQNRLNLDIDCGVLFWGGAPKIVTHEGVNLTDDVVDIKGKVGDYVDLARKFKVYPMLEVRLSYRLF